VPVKFILPPVCCSQGATIAWKLASSSPPQTPSTSTDPIAPAGGTVPDGLGLTVAVGEAVTVGDGKTVPPGGGTTTVGLGLTVAVGEAVTVGVAVAVGDAVTEGAAVTLGEAVTEGTAVTEGDAVAEGEAVVAGGVEAGGAVAVGDAAVVVGAVVPPDGQATEVIRINRITKPNNSLPQGIVFLLIFFLHISVIISLKNY
jgi:hypothetical protein